MRACSLHAPSARHRPRRTHRRKSAIVLPISFGSLSTITPVNRNYLGVGPINLPPMPAPSEMIPAALSAAHLNGIVTVVCTVQPPPARLSCVIETEAPTGYGLGETVLHSSSAKVRRHHRVSA